MKNLNIPKKTMENSHSILEIGNSLKDCDGKDVIVSSEKNILYIDKLCEKVLASLDSNLEKNIARAIRQKLANQWQTELWLNDGEKCEILKANSLGWQKGKLQLRVNFTLDFIPHEPKSEKSQEP